MANSMVGLKIKKDKQKQQKNKNGHILKNFTKGGVNPRDIAANAKEEEK